MLLQEVKENQICWMMLDALPPSRLSYLVVFGLADGRMMDKPCLIHELASVSRVLSARYYLSVSRKHQRF